MRERGAFGFFAVIVIVTIWFFSLAANEADQYANGTREDGIPTVIINGRSFESSFVAQGNGNVDRRIIVVDQDDLFVGENTVEIHWGSGPSSTMMAELPSGSQQR